MIKAFTVWQPWASLIMIGAKPLEFRSWSFVERRAGVSVGDRVGIHAGARPIKPGEVLDLLNRLDDPLCSTGLIPDKARPLLLRLQDAIKCRGILETSALLGSVVMGAPRLSIDAMPPWRGLIEEIGDSDRIEHCKWAWPMNDVRPAKHPIPMNGLQGFWNASVDAESI